ncbi:MAG TPA: xylulokinase [Acidobacteriota bacterium]|jgi:xylulokinase
MIFLGIDCGTQSLKTIAWDDESGIVVDSAQVSYPLIEGLPPGHKEQHPQTWTDALDATLAQLKERGKARFEQVAGIGISGQQHGFVPLDSSHQVIRPAKLWCDTATEAECEILLREAGGLTSAIAETGNGIPAGFTISKVRWLRDHEPANYRRLAHILLPHDYLNFYLTGERVAECGDASGTGFFQVRQRQWSRKALGWIDPDRDLSGKLPRLISSDQPAGTLRPVLAGRWGISPQALVSSGGGDNMMGAIGTGNVSDGIVTASLGTSGTLYASVSSPVIDAQGEIAAFCDSTGRWLPLACTMNVTVATEMVRSGFFAGADFQHFDAEVSRVRAGSDGLILLPYLEGERMPNVPQGTGVLLGLRPRSASRGHLARAAMEGVTLGLRYGLDRMKSLGIRPREIRLTGGGARSRVWRQIVADIFQTPVSCLAADEGAAFGAALQAFWMWTCQQGDSTAMGQITEKYVALSRDACAAPDPGVKDCYSELYQLYVKLSGLFCSDGGADSVFARHRRFVKKYS